jgi:gamma-glutamyltranspeptidase/glutathione hydrolase
MLVRGKNGSYEYIDFRETAPAAAFENMYVNNTNVARNGFPVTEDLVRYMKSATAGIENFLVKDPTWAIDFAPNGTLLGLGDTITRRRYADTLEAIAKRGIL